MIAVDTSALMAIILGEPVAEACIAALEGEPDILISAGTLAEALIVSAQRNVSDDVSRLVLGMGFEVVPLNSTSAVRVGRAYEKWGKGIHPAGLNFGDCFAYEVAKEHNCPLLYVGNDFSKTDILSVLR